MCFRADLTFSICCCWILHLLVCWFSSGRMKYLGRNEICWCKAWEQKKRNAHGASKLLLLYFSLKKCNGIVPYWHPKKRHPTREVSKVVIYTDQTEAACVLPRMQLCGFIWVTGASLEHMFCHATLLFHKPINSTTRLHLLLVQRCIRVASTSPPNSPLYLPSLTSCVGKKTKNKNACLLNQHAATNITNEHLRKTNVKIHSHTENSDCFINMVYCKLTYKISSQISNFFL